MKPPSFAHRYRDSVPGCSDANGEDFGFNPVRSFALSYPSPLIGPSPAKISPYVHAQYHHANEHRTANDTPLRQVGIHNRIENAHQKGSVRRFNARPSFKPRFSQGQRTRQPRNGLDDDGIDERNDVQRSQNGAAVRYCPAEHHPNAPQ